jgi:thioesterase domain-containing protein
MSVSDPRPTRAGSSLLPAAGLEPGQVAEFMYRLRDASKARATFAQPLTGDAARRATRLCKGEAPEKLVCFPAPLALCGPQQYVKLARQFAGSRELAVLTMPGFIGKEALPATLAVAIEDQAAAIARASADAPPILVGYSSGGVFAYGLAAHLESLGRPVAAVVLLDAYPPTGSAATDQVEGLMLRLLDSPEWRPFLNDTRLTAMGWYTEWVMSWPLRPIAAPTLMLAAEQPMTDGLEGSAWQPVWPFEHDLIEVPGDHFSMLQEHADLVAAQVAAWLDGVLG